MTVIVRECSAVPADATKRDIVVTPPTWLGEPEVFVGVSDTPTDSENYAPIRLAKSSFVTLLDMNTEGTAFPADATYTLAGGSDGIADICDEALS